MVKVMTKVRTISSVFVILILALTIVKSTTAQTPEEMKTFFSSDYAGISIKVNATQEVNPGENITIKTWIKCTADGVYVNYVNISVYGYRHYKYGVEKTTLNVTCIKKDTFLVYNHTIEHNYTVPIPSEVWDMTYAELHLKYAIWGTSFEYNPSFQMTIVRNLLWKELEDKLQSLSERYQQLNDTYWQLNSTVEQLNQTFWQMFQMNLTEESLAKLNETYWGLKGSSNELGNTRMAVGILAVTTVFFVATTLYLVMRKPRESW